MDSETRNRIQRATQDARALLEREYAEQLDGTFDIRLDGSIGDAPGDHLDARQRLVRSKIVAAVEHLRAGGHSKGEAARAYLREAAFTTLNRFVALKMLEARGLVQECVSRGEESIGFKEFTGLAPGLVQLPDHGYRLYIECIFDEIGREVRVLFDRRDLASLLWPRRQAMLDLLGVLNATELSAVWGEDETIGWVYQYFNGDDERRQMRAESQAPRNSRELAVRNQFFTPRYVVQFLTDNTLGRIWYEMRQGITRLRDVHYLVRRPNEAFLAEGEGSDAGEEDFTREELLQRPFHVPFRAKKDPRDIRVLDPACGSGHFLLYAFDLLLAIYEEGWANEGSPASKVTGRRLDDDYPEVGSLRAAVPGLILRHNLHGIDIDSRCAQIAAFALWMRAQRAFKDLGISRDARPAIRKTNIVVAEPMPGDLKLRSEFIATLEPGLAQLVERVFERMQLAGEAGSLLQIEDDIRAAVRELLGEHGQLFRTSDEERWQRAEEEVLQALQVYAERATSGPFFQRRLFAEDAARGLGLIDLLQHRYDVIVMNPPFGEPSNEARAYGKRYYAKSSDNLAVAFLLRGRSLRKPQGLLGAITDCSWQTKYDYRFFREEVLDHADLLQLVDLGWDVLDANVETSLSVFSDNSETLIAADLSTATSKACALGNLLCHLPPSVYDLSRFKSMPNFIFAYSLPRMEFRPYYEKAYLAEGWMKAVAGVKSCNSAADFRAWWEVPAEELGETGDWNLLHNGSPYCPFHYPAVFAVRHDSGSFRELLARGGAMPGRTYYSEVGCAYGKRTELMYAYVKRENDCFSQEGQALFPVGDATVWDILALANSARYSRHANYVAGQHKYHRYLNLIAIAVERNEAAASLARTAYLELLDLDSSNENSPHFNGVLAEEFSLHATVAEKEKKSRERLDLIQSALHGINQAFGIMDQDWEEPKPVDYYSLYYGYSYSQELVQDVWISWTVGVLFGRWRSDASVGQHEVLVVDPGHRDDVASLAWQVLQHGQAQEGSAIVSRQELAEFLRSTFFGRHIRRCTRGRRKAPIYWQLGTPSASYSVWLYYHKFTRDTLYRVLNEYVAPKLKHEERKLTNLTQDGGTNPSASQRKEIDAQESLVTELRAFREEVARVAPLWNPDLNDGVIINFAPLWRLVPQSSSWQKECQKVWDKLVAGDYYWAHLAMHLWPELVVPECAKDRGLAVAHGLEEVLWVEDGDGKCQSRKVARDVIDRLVKERTSAAVKSALAELLRAPAPAKPSGGRRGGGRRRRSASTHTAPRSSGRDVSPAGSNEDNGTIEAVKQAIAAAGEGASKSDVVEATGISNSAWNAAIRTLLAEGAIIKTGAGRGTRYHLAERGPSE